MQSYPRNRRLPTPFATNLLGITLALLLALGTGTQRAHANGIDDDRDGIPNSVECTGQSTELPLSVLNGSFETPDIGKTLALTSKTWGTYPKIAVAYKSFLVDGWSTTATDSEIEIWRGGYEGVTPYAGKQFAEINANQSAALYQDIATAPGSTMRWSFAHRGRTGVDQIELLVGPPNGPHTSMGTFSTGRNNWKLYDGVYVVPAGQTTTRFFYKAVSTANGNTTTGNFLDDIQFFVLGNCGLDTDGDGVINSSDLDSDNDGILDITEVGLNDVDGDGQVDQETELGTVGTVPDYDSDSFPDFLDLDSDNDGLPDTIEAQPTDHYVPPSGTVTAAGIDTAHENGIVPVDTDEDGDADYVDTDADEDGWSDTTEAHVELQGVDGDGDGLDAQTDLDDTVWGPPAAGITTTLPLYPNDGTETHWRNDTVEEDGTGVNGGESGGLESEPLPGTPSHFIGSIGDESADGAITAAAAQSVSAFRHKANLRQAYLLGLDDLMPAAGPLNTTPSPAVPADVLAVTNAPDAKAVDFVDPKGNVQAVALGILSLDAPYVHDYGVCNRFKGFTFDQIAPQLLDVPPADRAWFWHSTAQSPAYGYEDALLFHIFVNEGEKTFHIDSRWTQDSYDHEFAFAFDYIYNMQVWSKNPATSRQLLQAILLRLTTFGTGDWQVVYHNETKPVSPSVIVRQVETNADTIVLDLAAPGAQAQTVRIYGTWRSQVDRLTLQPFEQTIALSAAGQQVPLTLPGLLDATVYVESNGFVDKIYSGGGLWFAAGSEQSNADKLTLGECRDLSGVDNHDLLLAGCAELAEVTAATADSIGIGRTLNPNGMPVDVSPYQALRFWAKGSGLPIRILLETATIADADYYQLVFTPTGEWQQYIIPLHQFQQRGFGEARPFTGTDVKAVIWLNAEGNGQSMTLALDQVSFTNTGSLVAMTLPENSADTAARTVTFTAPDNTPTASVLLHYSVNDGKSYQRVPMNSARTTDHQLSMQGQLPAQPLGSEIRYFVEVNYANGYSSRVPIDAPTAYYRYNVDDRATLVVDDFGGSRPYNRLGGANGLFNEPTHGGTLRAYLAEQQLLLDYAVTEAGQYAGYFAELGQLDAQPYTTIDLLVRGERGGEQLHIGLRDSHDYEPRLSSGDFLPGGITQEWQWVQIPLAAFGAQLDRTLLESLSLTFYNSSQPASGRVYVQEIRFTTLVTAVVVDNFEDGDLQKNGQGLGYWTSAPNSTLTAKPVAGDATKGSGGALQLDYIVGDGGYGLWHSQLDTAALPTNGTLSFWARGEEQAVPASIYLTDGDNHRASVPLANYGVLDGQWQLVEIPLADFAAGGVDLTKLTGFEVAFEFVTGSGTLWIDNIRLGTTGNPQVQRRMLHLQDVDSRYLALHLADGGRWQVQSDVPWLSITGTNSVAGENAGADTLLVQSFPWGMAKGQYTGTLTITTDDSRQELITVALTVVDPSSASNQIFLPLVSR